MEVLAEQKSITHDLSRATKPGQAPTCTQLGVFKGEVRLGRLVLALC